jgi:hypothetical protein
MSGAHSKNHLIAELESTRSTFLSAIASLSKDDLRRRSYIAGWTNGELLFHMAFGFLIIPSLVRMIRFWSLFPTSFSKPFAVLLDVSSPAFNWINGLGPHLGARIYAGKSLGKKYDRTFVKIMRMLSSSTDTDLASGMYYPKSWDPLFGSYVTLEDLFHYPSAHLLSHLKQVRTEQA